MDVCLDREALEDMEGGLEEVEAGREDVEGGRENVGAVGLETKQFKPPLSFFSSR